MCDEPHNDLYDYLQGAKKRPQMYVRNWSIDELQLLCRAYQIALRIQGINEFGTSFYDAFTDFLQREYGWGCSNAWQKPIRASVNSDEEGFYRFFELVDEFCIKRKISRPS